MGSLRDRLARRQAAPPLSFDAVLAALGDAGVDGRRRAEVPVADVVGTLSRAGDFDQDFRLTNPASRSRWKNLALAMEAGLDPPPVDLIQVGDLYFVVDGHHRVSVARALGRDTVPARVLEVCTVAYGMCRLRMPHLEAKAAERRFLQRVPLDVGVRCTLWLGRAGDWSRLADAVEAWGFRRALRGGAVLDRCALARAWWTEEVMPVVAAARAAGMGAGLRDVQVYVDALTTGGTSVAHVRA